MDHSHTKLKHLARTSIPLMLTSLSGLAMLFVDRLFLANHSLHAMNAASSTGIISAVFIYSAAGIVGIAETFVGQYHGKKQDHMVAQPVWHMIFFSMACALFFIPIAHWGLPYLIAPDMADIGIPFARTYLNFGFLIPLYTALCAFFVGRSDTKIVFYVTLLGNIVNLILDYLLIFGIKSWLPAMGAQGAITATMASSFLQCLIMFALFNSKKYRDRFATHKPTWDKERLLEQLKKGAPLAFSHTLEIAAWAVCFQIAARTSTLHITIVSMGQNLFFLAVFLNEGLSRGIGTLAANLLGANKPSLIPSLLKSGFIMHGIMLLIAAIPLIGLTSFWADIFQIDEVIHNRALLLTYLQATTVIVWLYLLIDGIVWLIAGVLRAGGDTRFIFLGNAACSWFLGVIPTFIFIGKMHAIPPVQWGISVGYATVNAILFAWRYKQGMWKNWRVS